MTSDIQPTTGPPRLSGRTRGRGGAPKRPVSRAAIRRRRTWLAVLLLLAVLAAVGIGAWWNLYRVESDVPPGRSVQVEIPKGASSGEVAALLAKAGVVANSNMFSVRARLLGAGGDLKPGIYDWTTGSDYDAVVDRLQKGPTVVYATVVVPEGWTIEQIATRVEEKTGISADDFTKTARRGKKLFDYAFLADNPTDSLEGYLFPKTYRVKEGSSAEVVLGMMLTQYAKETAGLDTSYAKTRGLSMHDVVTVASMIEREARVAKDRPLVSSVIYNRLAKKMRLEIDATVQYVLGGKAKLLYSDLKVESPYNTYLHPGLPPGPIASPGLASLQAAVAPAKTGYLYYVLTHKDGSHTFATTYAEFVRLKAQAKKGLK